MEFFEKKMRRFVKGWPSRFSLMLSIFFVYFGFVWSVSAHPISSLRNVELWNVGGSVGCIMDTGREMEAATAESSTS